MLKPKRLHWPDFLKTLAIICVCTLHFPWCGNMEYSVDMSFITLLRRFLFGFNACAVPILVAVNGALLLNRPFDAKKQLKNTLRLFLQYVFWRAVTIIVIGLYEGIDFSAYNLTTMVNVLVLLQDFPAVNVNHLWFMPMLICIYVWLPFLTAVFEKEKTFRCILPFMGILLVFCFLFEDLALIQPVVPILNAAKLGGLQLFLPLSGTRYCSMLFYFLMGGLVMRYREKIDKLPCLVCLGCVLLGMLLLYLEWVLNSSYSGATYDNVFLSYDNIPCLLLSFGVFLLAVRSEELFDRHPVLCRFLSFVGSNTMSVYYFHWLLASTVFELLHFTDGIIFNFLKGLVLTLICSLAGSILKKLPLINKFVH